MFQPQHSVRSRSVTAKEFWPGEQANQPCGLSREKTLEAENTVHRIAPKTTGLAGEIRTPKNNRAQRGHHRFGRPAFVASRRPTRAASGGTPFFSRPSTRDRRVDSNTFLKKSRPLPSKNDSQRSITCPSGAESAAASSSWAITKACSKIKRWIGVRRIEIRREHGCIILEATVPSVVVPAPALYPLPHRNARIRCDHFQTGETKTFRDSLGWQT